jgi:hypothetical protein
MKQSKKTILRNCEKLNGLTATISEELKLKEGNEITVLTIEIGFALNLPSTLYEELAIEDTPPSAS